MGQRAVGQGAVGPGTDRGRRRVPAGGSPLGPGRSRAQATGACPVVSPALPSSPLPSLPLFGSRGGEARLHTGCPSSLPPACPSAPLPPHHRAGHARAQLPGCVPPCPQGRGDGEPSPLACPKAQPLWGTATGSPPAGVVVTSTSAGASPGPGTGPGSGPTQAGMLTAVRGKGLGRPPGAPLASLFRRIKPPSSHPQAEPFLPHDFISPTLTGWIL